MTKKKELEQALRITDEMILVQGIVLIELGGSVASDKIRPVLSVKTKFIKKLKC